MHRAPFTFYTQFTCSAFFLSIKSLTINLKCLAFPHYKPLPSSRVTICCRPGIQYSRWDPAWSVEAPGTCPLLSSSVLDTPSAQELLPRTARLALPAAEANIPVSTGSWAGLGRAWSVLNDAEKGTVDTLQASRKTACTAVTQATSLQALVFHDSGTGKL